jgi:DNA-binding NarL/FixJ family response regulator
MFGKLTKRETQIARLLALGVTNRTISTQLTISIKTVDTHRKNILRKLEAKNNVILARLAIQHGFVALPASDTEARHG